jgi:hypothetical protein
MWVVASLFSSEEYKRVFLSPSPLLLLLESIGKVQNMGIIRDNFSGLITSRNTILYFPLLALKMLC